MQRVKLHEEGRKILDSHRFWWSQKAKNDAQRALDHVKIYEDADWLMVAESWLITVRSIVEEDQRNSGSAPVVVLPPPLPPAA